MVPFPDSPVTPGQMSDLEGTQVSQTDPVRLAVHVALALYLSPVILVVCLIGGVSVVASGAAKFARRRGRDLNDQKIGSRPLVAQSSGGKVGPRRVSARQRSHAAH